MFFSLEKHWVGVVVSYCNKIIGLMLLGGCVIKSNCGCGHSSQVDCVEVVQFSFWSSLILMDTGSFCGNSIQLLVEGLKK